MKLRITRHYHHSPQYKRHLVREAKSQLCVDCVAEGRRADWPWPAMTLDHLGRKTMEFRLGGDISGQDAKNGSHRYGRKPPYVQFTVSEILRELASCEPVCGGHHNIRTRARMLARDIDEDDCEDQEPGEILLFE